MEQTLSKSNREQISNKADSPVGSEYLRSIELRDLLYVLVLPAFAVAAWIVPERAWLSLARGLVGISLLGPGLFGKPLLQRVRRATTGYDLSCTPEEICNAFIVSRFVQQFQYYRSYRPDGWRPPIRLIGREHLDAALTRGRGAILWISPFASSDIVSKMGFHEAGFAVSHLSNETHGYSDSRFGSRTINAVNRRIEDRFLHERVLLSRGGPLKALRTLQLRLRDNGVVSITAVINKGGQSIDAPFLNSRLVVGSGAADLAYMTSAALLPTVARHDGEGGFIITVASEIDIARDQPRKQASRQALAEFAKILEAWVLSHPDQWLGWTHLPDEADVDSGRRTVWDWINKKR